MKLQIIHVGCGGEVKLLGWDDGGCGDPECCGGRSEGITAMREKCKEEVTVYHLSDGEDVKFEGEECKKH